MSDSESGSYAIPLLVLTILAGAGVVGATIYFTDVPNPLGGSGSPDAREFSMEYNEGTAIILFEGGKTVESASSLLIRIEGGESWTWDELDTDTEANDPVDPGEKVAVTPVEPGDTLTVTWRDGEGNSRQVAKWTV